MKSKFKLILTLVLTFSYFLNAQIRQSNIMAIEDSLYSTVLKESTKGLSESKKLIKK